MRKKPPEGTRWILNKDWKNNPDEFNFKSRRDGDIVTISIDDAVSFGINDFSRYVKHTVEFDASLNNTNGLSKVRKPIFEERTLFLKVLIAGNISLLKFEDARYLRFYYLKEGEKPRQLVYKRYKKTSRRIAKNIEYQQQIILLFQENDQAVKQISKLEYREKPLVKIFHKLNNDQELQSFSKSKSFLTTKAAVALGGTIQTNKIDNPVSIYEVVIPWQMNYVIGTEIEFILPFRKEFWSTYFGAYYQSYSFNSDLKYKSDGIEDLSGNLMLTYQTVQLDVGFKNRFKINGVPKIYVFGSFSLNLPMKKNLLLPDENASLLLNATFNHNIGVGYLINENIAVDLFYSTRKNFVSDYEFWDANQQGPGMVVKYIF